MYTYNEYELTLYHLHCSVYASDITLATRDLSRDRCPLSNS